MGPAEKGYRWNHKKQRRRLVYYKCQWCSSEWHYLKKKTQMTIYNEDCFFFAELQNRVDGLISEIDDKGDEIIKLGECQAIINGKVHRQVELFIFSCTFCWGSYHSNSYIKLYFSLPFSLVLQIITLQSQVEQLQRLLSNLKVLKNTEVTRKYLQHNFTNTNKVINNLILRLSVKMSLLYPKFLHMTNKYIFTSLNLSQSSQMILQPRRTCSRNMSMSWIRKIKQTPTWVSKEEVRCLHSWWRKYSEMSEISCIYFPVFVSSENNWCDQPTQKPRSRKAEWEQ